MQLFVPPLNPVYIARAENSFYKFGNKISGCQPCAHKYYGLVWLGLELGLGFILGSVWFNWFVLVLWIIMWCNLLNQLVDGTPLAAASAINNCVQTRAHNSVK